MGAQLLIVDDELEIRKSLEIYFKSLGYEVDLAEDGQAGIDMLMVKRFDIIVSDISMPRKDGIELLREVRHNYPMTRVIIITGYISLEYALSCMRLGADTCVFKPFDNLDELTDAVATSLKNLQQWQKKLKELVGMKSRDLGGTYDNK